MKGKIMNDARLYDDRLPRKDVGIAYLWWLFLGTLGAHKFYLGKPGWGVAYLLTLGFLWVGVIIDLFTIPAQVRAANRERGWGV